MESGTATYASLVLVALSRPARIPDIAADLRNALSFVERCHARLCEAETVRPPVTRATRWVSEAGIKRSVATEHARAAS